MASFQIHEDREITIPKNVKDNVENSNVPRRVLGTLNENLSYQRVTLAAKAVNKDATVPNRTRPPTKRDRPPQPPVAQFKAFSVYEEEAKPEAPPPAPPAPAQLSTKIKDDNHLPSSVLTLNTLRLPLQEKFRDVTLGSPMSVGLDSSVCPMSVAKSESQEETKATATTVRELFFHVAEYRDDIYNYMRDIEMQHRPKAGYMQKQPDISSSMRAILVDWLVEVSEEYRLQSETLYLSVSYIDRFLSYMSVVRAKLQLVGTAAMFIASKYEEIFPPELGEFVYITDDTYTKQQVLRMEHLILKVLSFDLSTPTPLAFISHFCITNGLTQKTLFLAMYISELALLEADPFLLYSSSILGAAAVAVARHALLCCHCPGPGRAPAACARLAWPEALQRSSRYQPAQLEPCARLLQRTHAAAPTQPHRAIPDKYKSSKYEGVSLIEAKAMYPTAESNESDGKPTDDKESSSNAVQVKVSEPSECNQKCVTKS